MHGAKIKRVKYSLLHCSDATDACPSVSVNVREDKLGKCLITSVRLTGSSNDTSTVYIYDMFHFSMICFA